MPENGAGRKGAIWLVPSSRLQSLPTLPRMNHSVAADSPQRLVPDAKRGQQGAMPYRGITHQLGLPSRLDMATCKTSVRHLIALSVNFAQQPLKKD